MQEHFDSFITRKPTCDCMLHLWHTYDIYKIAIQIRWFRDFSLSSGKKSGYIPEENRSHSNHVRTQNSKRLALVKKWHSILHSRYTTIKKKISDAIYNNIFCMYMWRSLQTTRQQFYVYLNPVRSYNDQQTSLVFDNKKMTTPLQWKGPPEPTNQQSKQYVPKGVMLQVTSVRLVSLRCSLHKKNPKHDPATITVWR